MKVGTVCLVFLCLAMLSAASVAAAHEYQTGKIVKVEKRESSTPSGGADAPLKAEVARYCVSIQLGETVYICSYKTMPDMDLSWVEGKDVEARVKGKTIFVKKANGKEAKGPVLSTSAAVSQ
jgi:hypothetical protein